MPNDLRRHRRSSYDFGLGVQSLTWFRLLLVVPMVVT
jgi:hypothetical protein